LSKFSVWEVRNVPDGQELTSFFKTVEKQTSAGKVEKLTWLVAQDLKVGCGPLFTRFKSNGKGVLEWQ
jgi:hypothetical protein